MLEALAKHQEQTLDGRAREVRLCRIRNTHDKTKVEIQLALRGSLERLRGTIRKSLREIGCDIQSGKAPMGGHERKVQEMLESWQI